MLVKIGHARHDENGKTKYGKAGDQTGKEVAITDWYLHDKGWNVYRCIDPVKRNLIAEAAEKACRNNHIGYDQNQRDTLFRSVIFKGYDPGKVTKNVETDCSALVRTCIAYAFKEDLVGNIVTATMSPALLKTKEFIKYTDVKHCESTAYLKRGDILCTKTKGHTVIVLNDGIMQINIDEPDRFNEKYIGSYKIISKSLNIRTGAGISRKKVGEIPSNFTVHSDGYYIRDIKNKTNWIKIYMNRTNDSIYGYVSSRYLKKI